MHYPHPFEIAAKRRKIALIIGSVVVVLAGVVYFALPSGPYYHGRTLTSWLQDYANPMHGLHRVHDLRDLQAIDFSQKFKGGERAVKAIGTNGLPTLLQLAQSKEREKRQMAYLGFGILQQDALPAVPTLMALTKDTNAETRIFAFNCLVNIELPNVKPLMPVLIQFSHDPDAGVREKAAENMRMFLAMMSNDEAKAAGVYDAFPELVSTSESTPHKP